MRDKIKLGLAFALQASVISAGFAAALQSNFHRPQLFLLLPPFYLFAAALLFGWKRAELLQSSVAGAAAFIGIGDIALIVAGVTVWPVPLAALMFLIAGVPLYLLLPALVLCYLVGPGPRRIARWVRARLRRPAALPPPA